MKFSCVILMLAIAPAILPAGDTGYTRAVVERLASLELEGREFGTAGGARAVQVVDSLFEAEGLLPPPGAESRLQAFRSLLSGEDGSGSVSLTMPGRRELDPLEEDLWYMPPWSGAGTAEGSLLAAGYGMLTGPPGRWDDYAHLDCRDRIVVIQEGLPRGVDAGEGTDLAERIRLAERMGAAALVVCRDPFSDAPLADNVDRGLFQEPVSIPVFFVHSQVADSIFKSKGYTGRSWISRMNRARKSLNLDLPDRGMRIESRPSHQMASGANVIGWWPGRGEGVLAMSAHLDHLGLVDHEAPPAEGNVYRGADDNASGVAAMLAALRRLKERWPEGPPLRGLLLLAFDGEEKGLKGSRHFAATTEWEDLRLTLNMDMVGRLDGRPLSVFGAGRVPGLQEVLEQAAGDLPLRFADLEATPSDHSSLVEASIPAVMLFSGTHEQYNTPEDSPERLDYGGLAQVGDLLVNSLARIAEQDLHFELEGEAPRRATGAPVKVAMGITPGYGGEGEGMEISRVAPGSPAEQAGLLAGDRLLALGEHPVTNIFDYTFALRTFTVGEPVALRVLRGSKMLELQVVIGERRKP